MQAITARELSHLTGQPDRKIRLVIEELIEDGLLVVSATEGPAVYFIPISLEEARSRAVEILLRRER